MERRKFLKFSGFGIGGAIVAGLGANMFGGFGSKENYYLKGNYAPVKELVTETGLEVIGNIPKDLNGLLLRNGPNPMIPPDAKKYHWFAGEGMLHGVRLDSGNALWYKNRLVSGNNSTANTSVISHADKIYAIVEAGSFPVEIDKEMNSLETKPFYGNRNAGFTAHPKLDANTGEMHAMCYDYANNFSSINYVVIDKDGNHKSTQEIEFPSKSMLHECAITENYMLVFDLAVTFSFYKLGRGYFPFSWNDNHQSRIGLLNRHNGSKKIKWFEIDPAYFFHTVNAYEDASGNVVVDAANYDRLFDTDWNGPFTESPPQLTRWKLNVQSGVSKKSRLDDRSVEFPRIHPDLSGKNNQFGYLLASRNASAPDFSSIVKYDFNNNSSTAYEFGLGHMGAEPVFVPSENPTSEDEGYLLSFVYNQAEDKSDLVVLNAQDLVSGPVARIKLPQRVPYGFHGNWVTL